MILRWLRARLARRRRDPYEWDLPVGEAVMLETWAWPEKRVLTDEEVEKFRAAFERAVAGEWPATIRPETRVTPHNTEEGQQ